MSAAGLAASPTSFTCGLCGALFTHEGRSCSACPLSSGCDLVRCPNCGFQSPRASRLVEWWRRTLGRRGSES